jgi:hypothetical protein
MPHTLRLIILTLLAISFGIVFSMLQWPAFWKKFFSNRKGGKDEKG